ncbi:unnamed protein product [Ambrosiozyma monospora]|uniref:Unnamed protein product n=1 Tax=Ambrosiozyma monospora TaxID=43982 RepID=A0A9W6YTU2_AMBMO|nr:unnamed protein product [Ambrosiozyma monospora]
MKVNMKLDCVQIGRMKGLLAHVLNNSMDDKKAGTTNTTTTHDADANTILIQLAHTALKVGIEYSPSTKDSIMFVIA